VPEIDASAGRALLNINNYIKNLQNKSEEERGEKDERINISIFYRKFSCWSIYRRRGYGGGPPPTPDGCTCKSASKFSGPRPGDMDFSIRVQK